MKIPSKKDRPFTLNGHPDNSWPTLGELMNIVCSSPRPDARSEPAFPRPVFLWVEQLGTFYGKRPIEIFKNLENDSIKVLDCVVEPFGNKLRKPKK